MQNVSSQVKILFKVWPPANVAAIYSIISARICAARSKHAAYNPNPLLGHECRGGECVCECMSARVSMGVYECVVCVSNVTMGVLSVCARRDMSVSVHKVCLCDCMDICVSVSIHRGVSISRCV